MYFENSKLRKIRGRSPRGESNRRNVKMTITPETIQMVDEVAGFGNGKYGSAVFELGARLLVALVTEGDYVEDVALDLSEATDSPYILNNLDRLNRLMKAHLE